MQRTQANLQQQQQQQQAQQGQQQHAHTNGVNGMYSSRCYAP